MKVKRILVIRHVGFLGDRAEAHRSGTMIRLGPEAHRISMMHEIGHCLEPGGQSPMGKRARSLRYLGGVMGLAVIQEEAAAWRWAVRAWTRRGRRLDDSVKAIIVQKYQTYLRRRKSQLTWEVKRYGRRLG